MTDRLDALTTRKTVQVDPVFTDFYNNFNVHPQNKRLALHTNEQAVRRSLRNILSTNTRERFFNPEFGGNLRRFLFEDVSVMAPYFYFIYAGISTPPGPIDAIGVSVTL